jgi:lipoprotein signal peptidase
MYVWVCMCVYVCIYVRMYVCMYILYLPQYKTRNSNFYMQCNMSAIGGAMQNLIDIC